MPKLTKKELAKQERYYGLMNANAKKFSILIMDRLGLEPEESTGFLIMSDWFESGEIKYFTYDGYKYVPFEYGQHYENNQEVKIFDPYNNIKLCINLIPWYIMNIMNVNSDSIELIGVDNSKMNDPGAAFIQFEGREKMYGNTYNRDCLKYADILYKLDNAHPIEYTKLKNLDIGQYDEFESDK